MASLGPAVSCPRPFINAALVSPTDGYVKGRFCQSFVASDGAPISCCLPCPLNQWFFDEDFTRTASGLMLLSPISFFSCVFLLITWAVLPADRTNRHYLNVGLTYYSSLLALALVITLLDQPDTCINAITPASSEDDRTCRWTGSFFAVGGMGIVLTVFLRTILLHLRVCWNRTPGKIFYWTSLVVSFVVPSLFGIIFIMVSGFAYRLNPACFLKHEMGTVSFWAWLVTFATLALALQVMTTGYCVCVFIQSSRMRKAGLDQNYGSRDQNDYRPGNALSRAWRKLLADVPSQTSLVKSPIPENTSDDKAPLSALSKEIQRNSGYHWRDIKRSIIIQWRIICFTLLVMVQTVFFASVFLKGDMLTSSWDNSNNRKASQFTACLVANNGDPGKCFQFAQSLVADRRAVLVGIGIDSLIGLEAFLFLVRRSMFTSWYEFLSNPVASLRCLAARLRLIRATKSPAPQPLPAPTYPQTPCDLKLQLPPPSPPPNTSHVPTTRATSFATTRAPSPAPTTATAPPPPPPKPPTYVPRMSSSLPFRNTIAGFGSATEPLRRHASLPASIVAPPTRAVPSKDLPPWPLQGPDWFSSGPPSGDGSQAPDSPAGEWPLGRQRRAATPELSPRSLPPSRRDWRSADGGVPPDIPAWPLQEGRGGPGWHVWRDGPVGPPPGAPLPGLEPLKSESVDRVPPWLVADLRVVPKGGLGMHPVGGEEEGKTGREEGPGS